MDNASKIFILIAHLVVYGFFLPIIAHSDTMHLKCQPEFEKFIHIEEEMTDFCSTVIRAEEIIHKGEDIHNFLPVKMFLNATQRHIEQIMANEQQIIENPLAMFKLKKWLSDKWTSILDQMTYSDFVYKHHDLRKLLDEFQTIVKGIDLTSIVNDLVNLMKIYKLPVHAVALGTFGHSQIDPLTSEEVFQFVESTNELGDHEMALQWLNIGLENCNKGQFDQTKVNYYRNLLASTYIKLNRYEEAKVIYESFLEQDINTRAARGNLQLINERLKNPKPQSEDSYNNTEMDYINKYCHEEIYRPKYKQSNLMCYETTLPISNETLRIEELNRGPQVVMIYDILSVDQVRLLIDRASNKLWDLLTSSFRSLHISREGSRVYFSKRKWWMDTYSQRLRNVTYKNIFDWRGDEAILSWLSVTNNGAGMRSNIIQHEETNIQNAHVEQKIAHYHIFLNEPDFGGNIVFPDLKLRIKPVENAAVFWQFRYPQKQVHPSFHEMIHCPILTGSQWNALATVEYRGQINKVRF